MEPLGLAFGKPKDRLRAAVASVPLQALGGQKVLGVRTHDFAVRFGIVLRAAVRSRKSLCEHTTRPMPPHRISEGSEKIQKRKVAGFLFGYMGAGTTPLDAAHCLQFTCRSLPAQ
jgi:hypothetical protein